MRKKIHLRKEKKNKLLCIGIDFQKRNGMSELYGYIIKFLFKTI